ncbi:uncharacterized protein LOC112350002 isoform X1 [Selaginella moellendorffii]|uniref:uncharacterized protein LOC112350002 isoform X1 n=1 Tax=Selaginella moellendorffii TaxID=88036 RepID=UPI000D1C8233|nr:uncharacterized protein LOC112350002 isoform X1 [Selaginella moellendorffii]|eukprot:XP_024541179.1 uncharacterized protein LOC112350002 isoform X1 [Selaginella moellendorffii]
MSSGAASRRGPPKHQNTTAWKPNKGVKKKDKELGGKMHPYPAITGVCARCKDKIEWRRRYGKYKALVEPAKCQQCGKRVIRQAYHKFCSGSVDSFGFLFPTFLDSLREREERLREMLPVQSPRCWKVAKIVILRLIVLLAGSAGTLKRKRMNEGNLNRLSVAFVSETSEPYSERYDNLVYFASPLQTCLGLDGERVV